MGFALDRCLYSEDLHSEDQSQSARARWKKGAEMVGTVGPSSGQHKRRAGDGCQGGIGGGVEDRAVKRTAGGVVGEGAGGGQELPGAWWLFVAVALCLQSCCS